ncbi:hypothetical protein C2845_PM16G03750 [Panicum miliaceum]|uniref:Uncharacterized protein n=1 Tax=Panicum miliaceum TaxID=4540 RepID=A0A3L6PYC9_PANMI|nr:hypothetical protein C2845_PM16G03750 [Panicum miliaceum]
MQKRGGRSVGYRPYTPAESNWGWHEEWFYIKHPEQMPFPAFTGACPVKKDSWTWGVLTAEKEKKARKAKRKLKKEQEIAHRVWMGEDRDVMQEELESESSSDSGDEDKESEY